MFRPGRVTPRGGSGLDGVFPYVSRAFPKRPPPGFCLLW